MIVLGMQGPLIFTYIIEERGFEVPQFAFSMAALGAGALLSAALLIWTSMRPSLTLIMAFYGIQEPFLVMGLVFLLLILPFSRLRRFCLVLLLWRSG